MDSNMICGEVLSRDMATHFLGLSVSLYKNITKALTSNGELPWSNQTAPMWAVDSARKPDPMDEAIVKAKGDVVSQHVRFYEEYKAIKYDDYTYQWPRGEYPESGWASFTRAMDQDQPIYQLRNWFSHELGRRTVTLGQEKENFGKLLSAYQDFLPVLEELMGKLEAGLEDGDAWASSPVVAERKHDPQLPAYSHDCEAVLLRIRQQDEAREERMKEAERQYRARSARAEEEERDPWGCEEWVQTEEVGEEWGQATEVDEAEEWVWGAEDSEGDISEEGEGAEGAEGTEGLLAPVSSEMLRWEEPEYGSGYEKGAATRVLLCPCSCTCKDDVFIAVHDQAWTVSAGTSEDPQVLFLVVYSIRRLLC